MKFDLKILAEVSMGIVFSFSVYLGVLWFLAVGLASMITLTGIIPIDPTFQIGAVTGVLTLCLPLLIGTYWLQNYLYNKKGELDKSKSKK